MVSDSESSTLPPVSSSYTNTNSNKGKLRKLILTFPYLLSLDYTYFIKPNMDIVKRHLDLDDQLMRRCFFTHPLFVAYNPRHLELKLVQMLYFLTGLHEYQEFLDGKVDYIRDHARKMKLKREKGKPALSSPLNDKLVGGGDMLYATEADIEDYGFDSSTDPSMETISENGSPIDEFGDDWTVEKHLLSPNPANLETSNLMWLDHLCNVEGTQMDKAEVDREQSSLASIFAEFLPLHIDKFRAQQILRSLPWVTSYSIERNKRLIFTIAVTLGLTPAEMRRTISWYPRLMCNSASPQGKLAELLQMLSEQARYFLQHHGGDDMTWIPDYDHPRMKSLKAFLDNDTTSPWSSQRRDNTIRSMVRFLIVADPILLGNSVERTRARFHSFFNQTDVEIKWDKSLSRYLRRTQKEHDSYLIKAAASSAERKRVAKLKAIKMEEKSIKAINRKPKLEKKQRQRQNKVTSFDALPTPLKRKNIDQDFQVEFARAESQMDYLMQQLILEVTEKNSLMP